VLRSVAPYSLRTPLFHAQSAQLAWNGLVRECGEEAQCAAAFPHLQRDFDTVRARLRGAPALVTIQHPATGQPAQVRLSETAFGEAVRVMMYDHGTGRRLPLLISDALNGKFEPFATAALQAMRRQRDGLRLGMLQSIMCNEDLSRIAAREIAPATRNTFLGDTRVRDQLAACAVWPSIAPPAHFDRPTRSEVPALLISGNLDPVTPPQWAEQAARYFPRGMHIIVPGGHVPDDACTLSIIEAFLRQASVRGLDTSCAAAMPRPRFLLPAQTGTAGG
jgi:pimeloyl-ACP methyl ester carboxylesterase